MAIRLSGLISGLDTESLVKEMMSVQNQKKTKVEGKITQTTSALFGECLHNYLIKDAIFDNNVLGA